MTGTNLFIDSLLQLEEGSLALLRKHAGTSLNESVRGFDLFTGVWWPLRQRNERAPRREVAWLVAKVYSARPIPHASGSTLARQLRRCEPPEARARKRFRDRFDRMLACPLSTIESPLVLLLGHLERADLPLDWVKITDDLSIWEIECVRRGWAEEYLDLSERSNRC